MAIKSSSLISILAIVSIILLYIYYTIWAYGLVSNNYKEHIKKYKKQANS